MGSLATRQEADSQPPRTTLSDHGRIAADFQTPPSPEELRALREELRQAVSGEVGWDAGHLGAYSTDASNYRQIPLCVVIPRTVDDVVAAVAVCRRHKAAVVPRGGGTGLAGQSCNVAVVIDFSRHLNGIVSLDPDGRRALVQPGCILDTLRDAAEEHGLTFGPDPSTHSRNSLGGMIGNDSCGVHSIMSGRTSANIESLDILTYDGLRMTVGPTDDETYDRVQAAGGRAAEIYRALAGFRDRYADEIRSGFPKIPRRVSGYSNLDGLLPEEGFHVGKALVGTEATCVIVLGACVKLIPSRSKRVLAILGFDDVFAAADAVLEVLGYEPIGLEGLDEKLIDFMRTKELHQEDLSVLPEGRGWLLAEFGHQDDIEAAARQAEKLATAFRERGHGVNVVEDKARQQKVWEVREAALAATAHVPGMPETWPGWEDSAVRRENLGDYLRDFRALLQKHGYDASFYGHFGDGLLHCRIDFDLHSEDGLANWQRFLDEAADLVVSYGGSLSGEHGDGQARAALLEKMYGPGLMGAFRDFKAIWDPDGRMNPGKVVDPFPPTSNLRVGPGYQPKPVDPVFAYPEDDGDFARATRRCVGVGACRRIHSDGGVMCPSYMATRDERHSTRGRSRLLFEMLRDEPIGDGFRSEAVEEALDLCLACKGCKSDCPVHVDMATYKAEFRSHHYARRLRPRSAYSMGLIRDWSRLASVAPGVANFFARTPPFSGLGKWIAGIAPQRSLPAFSNPSFRSRFAKASHPKAGRRVVLWPDTFNNYFRAETAEAATAVLEHLGFHVVLPAKPLCCGRPLYDWGFLDRAKVLWGETLDCLEGEIGAGTPVAGLEPACVSAFRDELPNLLPEDARAKRLASQTLFFSEFLQKHAPDAPLPEVAGKALVQLHCHHHAVLDSQAEHGLLDRTGLDYDVLASGCCGMAGSFGFEKAKYDVSMTAGERVLLPRIRAAAADTVVLADGFSCREQVEQSTGRRTLHVAELLARSLRG